MKSAIGVRMLDLIKLEIRSGASSALPAFAGAIHLNDVLHSAGLITNDAWNDVKGVSSLDNLLAVSQPVLKTLVEGGKGMTQFGQAAREGIEKLAAVASSNADEAIEG
jgi:hypothetical protein